MDKKVTKEVVIASPKASHFRLDPKFSIRPHSAKPKKKSSRDHETGVPPLDLNEKPLRPWSAHPKSRSHLSPKRIVRETLKKPHLQPPIREVEVATEGQGQALGQTEECMTVVNLPGLDITPRSYSLASTPGLDGQEIHLDDGVKTLVSGNRILNYDIL